MAKPLCFKQTCFDLLDWTHVMALLADLADVGQRADPARIYPYVVYTLSQLSEWGEFWGFQIPAFQYQTERIPNGKIDKKSVNHFLPLYLTS